MRARVYKIIPALEWRLEGVAHRGGFFAARLWPPGTAPPAQGTVKATAVYKRHDAEWDRAKTELGGVIK